MKYLCESCISKPECKILCVQQIKTIGAIIRKIRSYPTCKKSLEFKKNYPNNYKIILEGTRYFYDIKASVKGNKKKYVVLNREGKVVKDLRKIK